MSSQDFSMQGFDELDRRLSKLGAVGALKELRSAMRVAANVVRKAARERAPVGETGALAKGIKTSTEIGKQRGEVVASVSPGRKQFYGMFLEFGTVKMRARPWLQPAIDATKDDIVARLHKHLWRRIEKLTGAK